MLQWLPWRRLSLPLRSHPLIARRAEVRDTSVLTVVLDAADLIRHRAMEVTPIATNCMKTTLLRYAATAAVVVSVLAPASAFANEKYHAINGINQQFSAFDSGLNHANGNSAVVTAYCSDYGC